MVLVFHHFFSYVLPMVCGQLHMRRFGSFFIVTFTCYHTFVSLT